MTRAARLVSGRALQDGVLEDLGISLETAALLAVSLGLEVDGVGG